MKARIGSIVAAVVLLAPGIAAQSAEEQVEEAVLTFYRHLADGNAAAWASFQSGAGHGNFARTGFVLGTNPVDPVAMQTSFDSGALSYQLTVHELKVTVYGNTAVATFYTTGPSLLTSGARIEGTYRVSQVWIREGREWKAVHFHISPLVA